MIDKPGLYQISMDEYQTDPCVEPSLSSGIAKLLISHSPAHAWTAHPRLNPAYANEEASRFDIGNAAHAMLLEGVDACISLEFDDWRKKEAQAAREQVRAAGRIPLLQTQYVRVRAMVEVARQAIAACPDLAGYALEDMLPEQTLIWRSESIWCRARLDALSKDRNLILDYKTTAASASPFSWPRTMMGALHEIQAAFYLRGNAALDGPEQAKFVFVVQEIEPPYAVSFQGVSPAMLAIGESKVAQAIWQWQDCIEKNRWPAYPARICWIEPPAYAMAQWEEQQVTGHAYDPATLFGDEK